MGVSRMPAFAGLTALLVLAAPARAHFDWLASLDRQAHDLHLLTVQASPRSAFESWVQAHEKPYASLPEEFERRFAIWQDNLQFVLGYNQRTASHWVGLNALADLSHEEYRHRLGYRPDLRQGELRAPTEFMYGNASAPPSIDWRKKGAVTRVKNQQQCGSCWSFSTTGSIEGANAIYTGNLTSLSEQELVDCDRTRDHGCHGGLMDYAFNFVLQNGGLDTEEDYKYIAEEEKCSLRREHRHVVTIDGYQDVPANNETALMQAVAHQPISVAIEADQREFQLYNGGVFDGQCGIALDHGVLVVGYGTEGGKPFWTIKNSWGPLWGDGGYIRLVRNLPGMPFGQCGLAMQASFPIKKTPNPPVPAPTPPRPKPPAPPAPVACDSTGTAACPAGSTCCCSRSFLSYCLAWACCPLVEATCCDDHEHCCPHTLPVCDTAAGRCLAGRGQGFDGSVPWFNKTATLKVPGREHSWLSGLPNLPHLPTAASVKSTLPAHGAAPAKKTIAQMIDEALEESPEPEHVHSAAATADE